MLFFVAVTGGVTEDMLEPLIALVQSTDMEVQTASSLALSNFALFGPGLEFD